MGKCSFSTVWFITGSKKEKKNLKFNWIYIHSSAKNIVDTTNNFKRCWTRLVHEVQILCSYISNLNRQIQIISYSHLCLCIFLLPLPTFQQKYFPAFSLFSLKITFF